MAMKMHIGTFEMCLFMPMLFSKIKIEIDINNDKLSRITWEHMRVIKMGERDLIQFQTLLKY
jgi:hypothetical protein